MSTGIQGRLDRVPGGCGPAWKVGGLLSGYEPPSLGCERGAGLVFWPSRGLFFRGPLSKSLGPSVRREPAENRQCQETLSRRTIRADPGPLEALTGYAISASKYTLGGPSRVRS